MAAKVLIVLVVVLAVQLAARVEASGISDATKLKLTRAIIGTIEAKKHSAGQINVVTREIEKNIDVALNPIEKQIDTLKQNVKVAQDKAKAQNVDISECVQAERDAVHKLDKKYLKDCKRTPIVKQAEEKLALIGKEIENLRGLKKTCETAADPDQCVLKGIDASNKSTVANQKEVASIMKKAKPVQAAKCIAMTAGALKSHVDDLSKEWSACLEKHHIKEM